jgi:hypothetical protein
MTNQFILHFEESAGEEAMRKKRRRRCPRCRKLPDNIADPDIGFAYSCLCCCAMLGRFSFDEETAIDNWNYRVLRQQRKSWKLQHERKQKRT